MKIVLFELFKLLLHLYCIIFIIMLLFKNCLNVLTLLMITVNYFHKYTVNVYYIKILTVTNVVKVNGENFPIVK